MQFNLIHMADAKNVIAGMLKENTGIHMLDSGFEGGRNWQRNQTRNFEKEPASTLSVHFGRGEIIIQKSTYHYLTEFFETTQESERLNRKLREFADLPENEDLAWLQIMEEFFEQVLKPEIQEYGWDAYNVEPDGKVVNTYNYESSIDQVLQYMLFPWVKNQVFIILQIHGGADVRGGYTVPQIFAFKHSKHDIDEFILVDPDFNISLGDEGWYTDDFGYHWYRDWGSEPRYFDQAGMAKHIQEGLRLTDEEAEEEGELVFEGDLHGTSIGTEPMKSPMAGRRIRSGNREFDLVKATNWLRETGAFPFRLVLVKTYYPDGRFHECATFMENLHDGNSDNQHDFYHGSYHPNPDDNEEVLLEDAERIFEKRLTDIRKYHPEVKVDPSAVAPPAGRRLSRR